MTLEQLIKKEIENVKNGIVDDRINTFVDYKSKYAVLRPEVKVEISLSKGVVATIDVSDYFREEIK